MPPELLESRVILVDWGGLGLVYLQNRGLKRVMY